MGDNNVNRLILLKKCSRRVTTSIGISHVVSFTLLVVWMMVYIMSPQIHEVQAAPDIVRRYNCGGPKYTDGRGQNWAADLGIAKGGQLYSKNIGTTDIRNTVNDKLFTTYRYGQYKYEIPLPNGSYEIFLYFAEINLSKVNERIFSVTIQDKIQFNKIDLLQLEQKNYVAIRLESVAQVTDGILRIGTVKFVNQPIISAMEILFLKPHLAHAVVNGPYIAVDTDNVGVASIRVDGSNSHTHGVGLKLEMFEWRIGTRVVGRGEIADILALPVGEHIVTLYVRDSDGNKDNESTTITIFPFGYPAIDDIYPTTGNIAGGGIISIFGSGFAVSDKSLVVRFGLKVANRQLYRVINDNKLEVTVPAATIDVPVDLIVETSEGKSNAIVFTYVSGTPIAFTSQKLKNFEIGLPTVLTFDNNGVLYIATADGKIARLRLSDDFTTVTSSVVSSVLAGRTILGIAADPMGPQGVPEIYVSHSQLFHGESKSTSGLAINGKVSRIEGANMDLVVDIITGLPVADHDHAVNGIEFGDKGELYIQIGGNTNAGVPGRLTGKRIQKESPLSAATIRAQLSDPKFNGHIRYDAADDGNVVNEYGIRVFASGQRNSFDITLHSNGKLYATDNGPNAGFGKRATGCGLQQEGDDPDEPDKLNLIIDKRYYGHPNRKRGARDKKQCVWRSVNDLANADYKAPMMTLASSTTGIVEFQTNQFEGQLRNNLIVSKYKDGLFRIILRADGEKVIPESIPPIPLVGDNTLSVTQAPDGALIDTRYTTSQIFIHIPIIPQTNNNVLLFGVYPRRGSVVGGYILSIYGRNFLKSGITPIVEVGARRCPILTIKQKRITCRVFGGVGKVDVRVIMGRERVVLTQGFRYIRGRP